MPKVDRLSESWWDFNCVRGICCFPAQHLNSSPDWGEERIPGQLRNWAPSILVTERGADFLPSHPPEGSSAQFQAGWWILRTDLTTRKREVDIFSEVRQS